MSNPLIDLSEFTYGDYKRLEAYMEESNFLNESKEETEVNNLIAQLKKINSDIDNGKVNTNTTKEISRIVAELNQNAENIRKGNIRIYTTVFVVAELTKITLKLISIVSFIRSVWPSSSDVDDGEEVEVSEKDIKLMKKLKYKWLYVGYKLVKSIFTKETFKDIIKSFFSIKTIIDEIRDALINYTIRTSKAYMGYEKNADKSYEILINAEAKLEVEKKDAEKSDDKYTAECCDKIIKAIEEIKKDRVKQVMMKKQAEMNEDINLHEDYLGNEYKITSFKLIMRDIDESLIIESENLRHYCNTALFIIRRALEANDNNSKTKIKLIEERIKAANSFVNDINRQYDKTTLDTLLKKYSNIFSVKYSSYGLKARVAFEKKLVAHRNTILSIIKDYYHSLSSIASGKETEKKRIDTSLKSIYSTIENKVSPSDFNKIKELINKINDDSIKTFDLANDYIKWCKDNLKTQEIRNNLLYVTLNAVFKDK